jgi:hypothetical protein
MFWKFAFVVVALIAVMVVARDQHLAGRVGVTGSCTQTQPPSFKREGAWYACKQGVLTGFPSLEDDGCDSAGIVRHQEVWQCSAPLVSAPGY